MMSARVYAIIPVYNRLEFTLNCIKLLRTQNYECITIIVSDGGSTDGTASEVQRRYPEVVVLASQEELWWAGSMKLGIEYVLNMSHSESDYVLMMNNDTEIGSDYVATLVEVADDHGAAVGATIVDSRDPTCILDAGEYVCWNPYSFPLKSSLEPDRDILDDVSVLPGRGSLVPLRWVRMAGNVDADTFPHYLADYEFFYRLRIKGCPLLVSYRARLQAHIEETGLVPTVGLASFASVWSQLFARRSMGNVIDHWRFVARHAPPKHRLAIHARLAANTCFQLLFRTPARPFVLPFYWLAMLPLRIVAYGLAQLRAYATLPSLIRRYGKQLLCHPKRLPSSIRLPIYLCLCPGLLHRHDLEHASSCFEQWLQEGILIPLACPGWFAFTRLKRADFVRYPSLRWLFLRSWNPLTKLMRLNRYGRTRSTRSGPAVPLSS
jgi:hypothetical protein